MKAKPRSLENTHWIFIYISLPILFFVLMLFLTKNDKTANDLFTPNGLLIFQICWGVMLGVTASNDLNMFICKPIPHKTKRLITRGIYSLGVIGCALSATFLTN